MGRQITKWTWTWMRKHRLMYDNCCAALSWLTSKDVWITSYSLPMTASITGTVEMKQVDRVLLCKMLASQDASDVDRAILGGGDEVCRDEVARIRRSRHARRCPPNSANAGQFWRNVFSIRANGSRRHVRRCAPKLAFSANRSRISWSGPVRQIRSQQLEKKAWQNWWDTGNS